jgi:hypothetical protein
MGGVASSQQQPIFQPQPQHHHLAPSSFAPLHHQDTYGSSIENHQQHQDQQHTHQHQQQQQHQHYPRYANARPSTAVRPQLFSDFFRRYELMIEL